MSTSDATMAAFDSRLAALWTKTPVWADGDTSFVKPVSSPWVQTTVKRTVRLEGLGAPADRVDGLTIFDIFIPRTLPAAPSIGRRLGDELAGMFRGTSFSGIRCFGATVQESPTPSDDPYLLTKVLVIYRRIDFEAQEADVAVYVSRTQTQAAHGFQAGQALKLTGPSWALALADSDDDLAIALVTVARDANRFDVVYIGCGLEIELPGHGLGAPGDRLYLSQSVAGLATNVKPTSGYRQTLAAVKDSDHLIIASPRAVFV